MNVGGCLLITIVAWSVLVTAEDSPPKLRRKQNILPLLGFLQGYEIGRNFALQLPPFVFTPILVLPSGDQQNSNIQGSTDLGENFDTLHNSPVKLVNKDNENQHREFDTEFENFVTTESGLINEELNSSEEDTFRQNVIGIDNTTTTKEQEKNITTITTTESTDVTTEADLNVTTLAPGPYPTAVYKNELVDTIMLTEVPIETMIVLPSKENNWQNFRPSKTQEGSANENSARSDAWGYSYSYTRRPPYYYQKYPYHTYSNIDTSYISNSYVPDYSNHNRWHTYSSPGKYETTSQFRPLAGLYYDGFLHQSPVKKTGFVPYNNNYYY